MKENQGVLYNSYVDGEWIKFIRKIGEGRSGVIRFYVPTWILKETQLKENIVLKQIEEKEFHLHTVEEGGCNPLTEARDSIIRLSKVYWDRIPWEPGEKVCFEISRFRPQDGIYMTEADYHDKKYSNAVNKEDVF